jgi:HAD superfamily hydrolase (TIGR01509 family)
MFKHIIFDCDGVLIDSEIVAAEVMARWMREQGMDISTEQFIQTHTGKTYSGIIRECMADGLLPAEFNIQASTNAIETEVKTSIRPVTGVAEGLANITQPKSVVSNSGVVYIQKALNDFNIIHHFDRRLYSSEMVAAPKPSPLVYELAVAKIELPKADILVIEDSLTGVQAAKAAGLNVWGFLGGSHILPGHGDKMLQSGVLELVKGYEDLNEKLIR